MPRDDTACQLAGCHALSIVIAWPCVNLRRRDRSDVSPMTDYEIRSALGWRELGRTWTWIANQLNDERLWRDKLDRREVARQVQAHPYW